MKKSYSFITRLRRFMVFPLIFCQCSSYLAHHFNKRAAEEESRSGEIIETLLIKKGEHIADLGAGGGFFTLKFSTLVGESGKIYAVEINRDYLEFIMKTAGEKGITNIVPVLCNAKDSKLPAGSADLIFIRDVYHELSDRVSYFKELKKVLRPNGRVAIIDYKKTSGGFVGVFSHSVEEKTILDEMSEAGYKLGSSHQFIKHQTFNIFTVK